MNAHNAAPRKNAIARVMAPLIAVLTLGGVSSTAVGSVILHSPALPDSSLASQPDEPVGPEFVSQAINDAVVIDENGDEQFTELVDPARPDRLRIAKGKWSPGESRVLLEFDVSGRTPETIGAASLEFFIDLVADSSEPVEIYGYAGDGSLDLDDANRQGELLGSYDAGDLGIGKQSVALSALAMSRLLTPGVTSIEIRLEASASLVDTAIDKVDPLFTSAPPMLRLTGVPEPCSLALAVFVLIAAGFRRR